MKEIKTDDYTVTYDDTDEIKQAVFDRLIEYYKKYECFDGELIMQSDDPIIYAPDVLSDIADNIINFETDWD